jgi:hypothetical protein
MAETYFPFDAGAGSSVTEAQWSKMARLWRDDGVIPGLTNELEVTANASGMQVFVNTGTGWLRGFYYENSASLTLPLDAASVSDRIDRIVLRLDTSGNTIHAHVTKGTPAGSPVAPALQAGPTLWDLPLATVFVDSAAVNIASGDVTDGRSFSYAGAELGQVAYDEDSSTISGTTGATIITLTDAPASPGRRWKITVDIENVSIGNSGNSYRVYLRTGTDPTSLREYWFSSYPEQGIGFHHVLDAPAVDTDYLVVLQRFAGGATPAAADVVGLRSILIEDIGAA